MSGDRAACDLEITGHLVDNAEARVRQLAGEGLYVPVLCFEVECETSTRPRCIVQQPFLPHQEKACEAAAARLKRGTRVRFQVATAGIQILARGVSHVHVLTDEPAEANHA